MAQSRLQQLIDHLFASSATALVLESNTTGTWFQQGGTTVPAFRAPLRTGQILLLLSEVVPKDQSAQLLSGTPTRFTVPQPQPQGEVAIHVTLTGEDIRAEIIPVTAASMRRAAAKASTAVDTQTIEVTPALKVMLDAMAVRRASHLHLMPGGPVFARIDGHLQVQADFSPWSSTAIHDGLIHLAPASSRERLRNTRHLEVTHLTDSSVFHVQAHLGVNGYTLSVRCLPRAVPTLRSLHLPAEVSSMQGPGLWVISGASKQGSSTTLASVVQTVLEGAPHSVLMVDSPASFVLSPGRGMVQQLEVGLHHAQWAEAGARARGADFDLIALSSLDDLEALEQAVSLADQGRMVIGAVHAHSAAASVEKLSSVGESRLASVLRGVFGQRLISCVDGSRAVAWEYLPCHEAARKQVRAGAFESLAAMRSHSLDDSLCDLVRTGLVELGEALEAADDQQQLRARLSLQSAA